MELETIWGTVKTRKVATRLSRREYVLLKDNPQLKPLFDWLKISKVKTVKDLKTERYIRQQMIEALRNFEIKFEMVQDEIMPMLAFTNTVPLEGKFSPGIRECLKVFYNMMYKPDGNW